MAIQKDAELIVEKHFAGGPSGPYNTLLIATPSHVTQVSGLYVIQLECLAAVLQECNGNLSDPRLADWKRQDHIQFVTAPMSQITRAAFVPANSAIRIGFGDPDHPEWLCAMEPEYNMERLWQFLRTHLALKEAEAPAPMAEALFGSPLLMCVVFIGVVLGIFSRGTTLLWVIGLVGGFVVLHIGSRLVAWPNQLTLGQEPSV